MTGVDYESYLQNTFYKPLGASTITFNPYLHYSLERIVPTERDTFFRMSQVHGGVHDEAAAMLNGVSSNAGLFSTANDLAKLFQMYLNGGTYGGERYIAEETLKKFTTCQFCEDGNHRGLGFDKPSIEYDENEVSISSLTSKSSFGHSGYTGTFVWADPEKDLIFIFFSNRVFPTRDNRKLYAMNIRPKIMEVIYKAME
jgi:CubicO group peptidase (beta-lactamase class C family)